ncbi:MAG: HIT family protein [Actinomycetota bacterium]|nr:HIT family protein [Actinomycetota bacterium]
MAIEFREGCYACIQEQDPDLPPRDCIYRTEHWRVAHAFNSTLEGWLVILPTSHTASFTDLAPAAANELGTLVVRLSQALEAVTGAVKTYLAQFSEAPGFSHLHLHLIPRLANHPVAALGPRVFTLLAEDETRWLEASQRDQFAIALRRELSRTRPHDRVV